MVVQSMSVGCQTKKSVDRLVWTLSSTLESCLDAFCNNSLHRIMRYSWQDHVSNQWLQCETSILTVVQFTCWVMTFFPFLICVQILFNGSCDINHCKFFIWIISDFFKLFGQVFFSFILHISFHYYYFCYFESDIRISTSLGPPLGRRVYFCCHSSLPAI